MKEKTSQTIRHNRLLFEGVVVDKNGPLDDLSAYLPAHTGIVANKQTETLEQHIIAGV